MIYFETGKKGFAIDAAALAGVAAGCPYVSYPGLPVGIAGIVQWGGRIFPVVNPFAATSQENGLDPSACTFLFSAEGMAGPFHEVAVAVPAKVRAWFPVAARDGVLRDEDGLEAQEIDLPWLFERGRVSAGVKDAA